MKFQIQIQYLQSYKSIIKITAKYKFEHENVNGKCINLHRFKCVCVCVCVCLCVSVGVCVTVHLCYLDFVSFPITHTTDAHHST
jgi:hypothetical protein